MWGEAYVVIIHQGSDGEDSIVWSCALDIADYMYTGMEIINATRAVTAVSFLSRPLKRTSCKTMPVMLNLNFPSIKERTASNKVKVEKLSWVSSIGTGSLCTLTTSLTGGLAEEAAIALEPLGRFDAEVPVNDVAAFLDKYPFFAFGVSFVLFFVIPLLKDQYDKSTKWVTAEDAYYKLRDEMEPQLVDIRTIDEITYAGSPDVSSFNKEVAQVTYEGDDSLFLGEMLSRFKKPAKTTLYILDMYEGNSMQVAQMLTRNGFKAAYAIRDGFQGGDGWQAVEERLFTNTARVVTRNGATVSPNHKVNSSASLTVKQESLKNQRTESTSIPSSMGPEVVTSSASQLASVISHKKADGSTLATDYESVSSSLDIEVGINLASQAAPVDVSSELPCLPRPLSPYPQYPDLKPPTSPTPSKPISKTVDASTNNAAAMADQKADISVSEAPRFSQPLSPYTQYPDLKPPTSPMPSKPTAQATDPATINSSVISNQNVDGSARITESAFLSSSSQQPPIEPATEASFSSRPLSPYAH
ncbi:hypothetical protein KI387_013021, partial [Taxus chinensis]